MLHFLPWFKDMFQPIAKCERRSEPKERVARAPFLAAFDTVSEDQKKEFFDYLPDAIVVIDESGRIRHVNNQFPQMFGYQKSEILGQPVEILLPEHFRQRHVRHRVSYNKKSQIRTMGAGLDLLGVRRDGGEFPVDIMLSPISFPTEDLVLAVIRDISERKRAEKQIAHMARHDPLTDLPNRAAFNECLAATLERASTSNESFALLCLDLDRFKEINDVFGHAVGDALLREVSLRLQAAVDSMFLARLGGDEFSVIAAQGPQPATAEAIAERLQTTLAGDIEILGQHLRIGLSVGIAIFPNDAGDALSLARNADAALYRAKAEGRGTIRFFEAEMDKRLCERRLLQHDLRSAVARGELILHYQPQAQVDGDIIGFEALVRWRHPVRGLLAPDIFIPLSEESGLIIQIGEWVLREACREAASWPRHLQIAVNLSPIQFRHGDLAALVHSILLETGLSPRRLELEITENVLIGDFSHAVSILRRLKSLGVRIAMDDFGTGYSSLSYLQSFPFDKIKIDRSFISNADRNAQSAAIVRAVIGLGLGLDMIVVAEGVETTLQLEFLAKEACSEMQGYLVGRPMPIEQYAEMVGLQTDPRKVTLTG